MNNPQEDRADQNPGPALEIGQGRGAALARARCRFPAVHAKTRKRAALAVVTRDWTPSPSPGLETDTGTGTVGATTSTRAKGATLLAAEGSTRGRAPRRGGWTGWSLFLFPTRPPLERSGNRERGGLGIRPAPPPTDTGTAGELLTLEELAFATFDATLDSLDEKRVDIRA